MRFNLKREAAPVATDYPRPRAGGVPVFQSQTRSRPCCHLAKARQLLMAVEVSISNEKPPRLPPFRVFPTTLVGRSVSISNEKPPRLPLGQPLRPGLGPGSFNLKREAAPVATPWAPVLRINLLSFNLKR